MTSKARSGESRFLYNGKVRIIELEGIADHRGVLTPAHFSDISFEPKHMAIVQARHGVVRGGHAHKAGQQALLCLSGKIRLDLTYCGKSAELVLQPCKHLVIIESPVWAQQTYYGETPSLLLLSDRPYDPDGYTENKE